METLLCFGMHAERNRVYLLSPVLMIAGIALYILLGELLKELLIFSLLEPYLEQHFEEGFTECLVETGEYLMLAALLIPIAWIFVIRPVNKNNRLQCQLLDNIDRQNELLRREIDERRQLESALLRARDEAEHAALAKAQFLAVMSHEIRNPLTAVIGVAELLETQESLPAQEKLISTLSQSSHALLGTVNGILDMSRLEATEATLNIAATELGPFCHSAVNMLRPLAERKGLALRCHIDERIPEVLAFDGLRMRQILVNLLSNAVKYTDHGSVALQVEHQGVQGAQHVLVFSVQDTGPGLNAQQQEAIFEAFTQAKHDHAVQGSGLGLWICQRLARLMQSEIQIESVVGTGSRFYISLCLDVAEQVGHTSSGVLEALTNSEFETGHLLLVDDVPNNLAVMSSMLRMLGYQTQTASNGQEAVDSCCELLPRIIFMDIQMPVMDGIEATKVIRELSGDAQQPWIIGTSGTDSEELSHIAQDAGINDVLSKPYCIADLKAVLKRACQGLAQYM